MLVVINSGTGNLRSVMNALDFIGVSACVADTPETLNLATKIILPGVGGFPTVMGNLLAAGWVPPIKEKILGDCVPILGICVGMQILCDVGTESRIQEGLGFIPGKVSHLSVDRPAASNVKIPHVGFNTVTLDTSSALNAGLGGAADFYFTHSYHMTCNDPKNIVGTCDHGGEFVASVQNEHICGVQFHPEKSQSNGLKIIQNFIENF